MTTLSLMLMAISPLFADAPTGSKADVWPENWVGYTEFQTNLPGGRHANVSTMRAFMIKADGSGRRSLADELTREKHSWTQFTGWSPDGKTAIIGRGWESAENAKWEEEHKTFRYNAEGWLYDMHLFDLASGKSTRACY